jgi:hypothetical protein
LSVASNLFDFVAEQIESGTSLDRLAARGTLRIVCKMAGLEPKTVTSAQLQVIFDRVLPGELENRGVAEPVEVCRSLAEKVAGVPEDQWDQSGGVDEIFKRLAGT